MKSGDLTDKKPGKYLSLLWKRFCHGSNEMSPRAQETLNDFFNQTIKISHIEKSLGKGEVKEGGRSLRHTRSRDR